jgi:hypothetical protein
MSRPLPSPATGLPRCSNHHAYVPCPLPRRIGTGACVDCFPHSTRPSPNSGRVGIRIVLFEACSGFTRVTARTLAQPPKAAFVTGLRRDQLPGHAARQLPAQSTTRWVEPSSTGVSRLRGAPEFPDIEALFDQPSRFANSETALSLAADIAIRRDEPCSSTSRISPLHPGEREELLR